MPRAKLSNFDQIAEGLRCMLVAHKCQSLPCLEPIDVIRPGPRLFPFSSNARNAGRKIASLTSR
jgi:hypothetical protein